MSSVLYIADDCCAKGYRKASLEEILSAAKAALAKRVKRGAALTSPALVRQYLMTHLATREHEVVTLLYLDNRHRLLAVSDLFRGTIDGAAVYPREVVKEALRHNAAAILIAHCHPSGVAEPSHADELITNRLKDALALVDIRVLDHLIVAGDQVLSFAESGLI